MAQRRILQPTLAGGGVTPDGSALRRRQERGADMVPHLPLRCTTHTAHRPADREHGHAGLVTLSSVCGRADRTGREGQLGAGPHLMCCVSGIQRCEKRGPIAHVPGRLPRRASPGRNFDWPMVPPSVGSGLSASPLPAASAASPSPLGEA